MTPGYYKILGFLVMETFYFFFKELESSVKAQGAHKVSLKSPFKTSPGVQQHLALI